MTEASYQQKLKLGLTGPETSTCVGAGLDRGSLYYSVCENCYYELDEEMVYWGENGVAYADELPPDKEDKHWALFDNMLRDVGVYYQRHVKHLRVDEEKDLKDLLVKAKIGGFRVLVDLCLEDEDGLEAIHTVAVIPATKPGHYYLLSTSTGFDEGEDTEYTTKTIAEYLNKPPTFRFRPKNKRRRGFIGNTFILPPERRPRDLSRIGTVAVRR